jgi:hypothetical protein
MISFDGIRFAYLIGSGPVVGTTKLSKPDLKLLSGSAMTGRRFPRANRMTNPPLKWQR